MGGDSELALELRAGTFTVQSLNHTKANTPYSFSRQLDEDSVLPLCSFLGDVTIRLQPAAETDPAKWSTYSSNYLGQATPVPSKAPILASHDLTKILQGGGGDGAMPFPLKVVRSYEASADGAALILRFVVTNTAPSAVRVGGLGFPMPENPGHPPKGIESTVWNDPHIGQHHGFVEYVRVVDDEKTMLIVADESARKATAFEAWRPQLEDLGNGDVWEWTVYSAAWAEDWKKSAQSVAQPGPLPTPRLRLAPPRPAPAHAHGPADLARQPAGFCAPSPAACLLLRLQLRALRAHPRALSRDVNAARALMRTGTLS